MRFTRANVMVNGVPATQYNQSTGQAELIFHDNITENDLALLNSCRLGEVKLNAAETVTIPSLWRNYGGYIKERSIEHGAELSDKLSNVLNRGFGKITEYASKFTDELNKALEGQGGTGVNQGNNPYQSYQDTVGTGVNGQFSDGYNPTNVDMKTKGPLNVGNSNGVFVANVENQDTNKNLGGQSVVSGGVNLSKRPEQPEQTKQKQPEQTKQYQNVNITPTKVSTGLKVELANTDGLLIKLDDSLVSIGVIALVQPIYLGGQTVEIELQLININPYEITINKHEILGSLLEVVK